MGSLSQKGFFTTPRPVFVQKKAWQTTFCNLKSMLNKVFQRKNRQLQSSLIYQRPMIVSGFKDLSTNWQKSVSQEPLWNASRTSFLKEFSTFESVITWLTSAQSLLAYRNALYGAQSFSTWCWTISLPRPANVKKLLYADDVTIYMTVQTPMSAEVIL